MKRSVTNIIRFILDECLPPVIRDNKYFMYPFFHIWFKGRNVDKYMNFKSLIYTWSEDEIREFYQNRKSIATERVTDLSERSIEFMIKHLEPDVKTAADVGCGNGYFLSKLVANGLECHGIDLINSIRFPGIQFHKGDIENLPFPDNAFDVVSCHHTLEHIIDLQKAVSELKRVAKKQLVIVVPCQRYYYYTLDEHVRFFPYKELLEHEIGIQNHICEKIWSDWVYIGYLDK